MSELVSKNAVVNEIRRWRGYLDDDMIQRITIGMNKLPSAEISSKTIFNICPQCGDVMLKTKYYDTEGMVLICPNCGMKCYE